MVHAPFLSLFLSFSLSLSLALFLSLCISTLVPAIPLQIQIHMLPIRSLCISGKGYTCLTFHLTHISLCTAGITMGCTCKRGHCQKCKKCKLCGCKCPTRQKRVRTGNPVGRPAKGGDATEARPKRAVASKTIDYVDDSLSDSEDLVSVGAATPKRCRLQAVGKKYDYENIAVHVQRIHQ